MNSANTQIGYHYLDEISILPFSLYDDNNVLLCRKGEIFASKLSTQLQNFNLYCDKKEFETYLEKKEARKNLNSDLVVHATPLHIGSVSSIHKTFLGRTCPHYDCSFRKNEQTGYYCCGYMEVNPPPMVIISNCCMPEQDHFQYFRSIFKFLELHVNSKILAEIYRGGGELLQVPHPELKEPVENYKKALRKAGEEIVKHKKLSEETKAELNKPLIPHERYVEIILENMDAIVAVR